MEPDRDRALERHRINYAWLVRLRWAAVVGQLVTVAVVHGIMGVALPLTPLLAVIAIEAATNVVCTARSRRARITQGELAATMALDVLLFTALLYFTGGPYNPFSFLYLVYIALGAVLLDSRFVWGLVALSLLGSGVLFVDARELQLGDMEVAAAGPPDHVHDVHNGGHAGPTVAAGAPNHMDVHLRGMWVALLVASGFIVYFLLRVRTALAARERDLSRARDRAARDDRLASLATLAAGAAHELATPLGTIAIVARETERELERSGDSPGALEDMRLIRREVDRCRGILQQMSTDAGGAVGEPLVSVSMDALLEDATANVRSAPPVHIRGSDGTAVVLPPRAVAQAIRGVVTNAQDASAPDTPVDLVARVSDGTLVVEVRDRGAGMAAETLARAGEPFFTTKQPGRGMGLGLFLTRAVVERLGGTFDLASTPGAGTVATLTFPAGAGAATKKRIDGARAAG